VAEDFIEDDFNLTGLSPYVPFWKEALEMVLDVDPGKDIISDCVYMYTQSHIYAFFGW
jgi:hypothetical protein